MIPFIYDLLIYDLRFYDLRFIAEGKVTMTVVTPSTFSALMPQARRLVASP
jgi:hypothetical protein